MISAQMKWRTGEKELTDKANAIQPKLRTKRLFAVDFNAPSGFVVIRYSLLKKWFKNIDIIQYREGLTGKLQN